jgi:hypothetical protein
MDFPQKFRPEKHGTPENIGDQRRNDALKTAFMQRQRYWIERAFEDAKGECGMADCQARKWSAWHHHTALVMMAMLFLPRERRRHGDAIPLLSCADVEDLLAEFLPRRPADPPEVVAQMRAHHRQRKRAIISHAKAAQALREAADKGGGGDAPKITKSN